MNSTHNTQLTQKAAQKEGDFEGAGRPTPLHASTWKPHNIKHHITLIPLWESGQSHFPRVLVESWRGVLIQYTMCLTLTGRSPPKKKKQPSHFLMALGPLPGCRWRTSVELEFKWSTERRWRVRCEWTCEELWSGFSVGPASPKTEHSIVWSIKERNGFKTITICGNDDRKLIFVNSFYLKVMKWANSRPPGWEVQSLLTLSH